MKQNHGRQRNKEEDLFRKQEAMLSKYGWMAHFVVDDAEFPNRTNYHTHGLSDTFNHPDLQICLPIKPEHAHSIFECAVNNIKKGFVYEPNLEYENILIGGYKVRFIEIQEQDRNVLRMIIPDENGKYEAPFYKEQLRTSQNSHQGRHRNR